MEQTDIDSNELPIMAWRISWMGYIWPIVNHLISAVIIGIVFFLVVGLIDATIDLADQTIKTLLFCVIALIVARLIINLLVVRSTLLYYDNEGIWLYSGIFPWSKGVQGMQWANIESVYYRKGFLSWLFKSYDVCITQKFTQGNTLYVSAMDDGEKITTHLNQELMERQKEISA